MDTYETDFSDLESEAPQAQQAQQPQQPQQNPYQPKVSPFADSPYVTGAPQQAYRPYQTYQAYQPPQQTYTPPAPAPKEKKSGRNWTWISVLSLVLCCAALVFSIVNLAVQAQGSVSRSELAALEQQIADLQEQIKDNSYTGNGNSVSGTASATGGLTPGQVYAQNIDSVVLVSVSGQSGTASGSGFVLTEDGYVVTNYHVVEGGSRFSVILSDNTEYTAELVGGDETNDIAVLKVDAVTLDPVELGSSDDLIVGDQVVAIGNPLGELTSTLTVGYISAKDRDVSTDGSIINMLQTDAAINSGNSGGPLFNMKGQVVGITTAKYSGESSSGATIEGIGFAIPIDDVVDLIDELIENGYVSRPYMGVYVRDMTESIGVYVESVEADGSAAAAGIQGGDIIVQLGDTEITTLSELTKALNNFEVGDTTTVTVYRNRQVLELTITFAEKPHTEENAVTEETVPSGSVDDWFDRFFGDGN